MRMFSKFSFLYVIKVWSSLDLPQRYGRFGLMSHMGTTGRGKTRKVQHHLRIGRLV